MQRPRSAGKPFTQDEDGAVSADWIALTAAVALLGVAAYFSAKSGVTSLTGSIATATLSIETDEP